MKTDADLEMLLEQVRAIYSEMRQSGEKHQVIYGMLEHVMVEYERWMHHLHDLPATLTDDVLNAVISVNATMLARVVDPLCRVSDTPEETREFMASSIAEALYEALSMSPDERTSEGIATQTILTGAH